jgi:hypothetical protein
MKRSALFQATAVAAALLFLGAGCAQTGKQPTAHAFGSAREFHINDTVHYADGLSVTLSAINDSRCPADVQCIWQGELGADLIVSGGGIQEGSKHILLGTERARTVIDSGYTFILGKTTETTATITVTERITGQPGQ